MPTYIRVHALLICLLPVVVSLSLAGCGAPSPGPSRPEAVPEPGVVAVSYEARTAHDSSPELLAEGRALYLKECAPCHGETGQGNGPAAYLLYPKPRDLTSGTYRMVSTWDGKPTDDDLYYTVSRGMPGSAMPSWAHLSERARWSLVDYVKSLARKPIRIEAASQPEGPGLSGTGPLRIPPEPPDTPEDRARGKELYAKACASCHGLLARGDGVQEQRDDKGLPTRPRDLTLGVYKGDPSPAGVYKRIVLGLPGSPMPSSAWAYPDDAWSLVHYIRSLSSDTLRERVEMKRYNLVAARVDALPEHPDAGAWAHASPVNLHLMPMWWRTNRPEELTVRALHDGKELALLLAWEDGTDDHTAIRVQDFRDAAAVELAQGADPPFFAMGEKGSFVDIWMWKAEKQADIDAATNFQDLEAVYPNIGIDSYPNLALAGVEQPGRHALTLASDATFVTGWGAGNIVSDPKRLGAVENLRAQGFGTLMARPRPDQNVTARGVWRHDSYRVLFRRALAPSATGTVTLSPGSSVSVAFAVWNGSEGDRDGKKSVTIWQNLWLANEGRR